MIINSMRHPIKLGQIFYDDRNGRYITPDGVGADPNAYSCIVEELDDEGELVVVGRQLFKSYELERMVRK